MQLYIGGTGTDVGIVGMRFYLDYDLTLTEISDGLSEDHCSRWCYGDCVGPGIENCVNHY
jgi:hypothetical protein